jgi:hypothetical protein
MSDDLKLPNDRNPKASLHSQGNAPPRGNSKLSLEALPRKHASAQRSSDPYNTSGSFDRTKNWTRVGKR